MKNIIIFCICLFPYLATATDYHVGSGQAYTSLGQVAWSSLAAGDTVYIHPGTYHEKINISGQGTEANPIRVVGVLDGEGNRTVIDGANATTPASADYRWAVPSDIQVHCLVSVMPSATLLPTWIEIKNIEITGVRATNTFTAEDGSTNNYSGFAPAIYLRSVRNVLVENCKIHGNNQGVYNWTGSGIATYDALTTDVVIRKNHLYDNGVYDQSIQHQIYTEALRTTIEYNRIGQNTTGATGSQIKDRSGGTIIRYNYFEDTSNGGWLLDLVDPENGWDAIGTTDLYKQTFVYGNVFRRATNHAITFHWNGDNSASTHGRATVSGGKLLFYNNTVVDVGNTTDDWQGLYYIFSSRGGSGDCLAQAIPGVIDIRNNVFAGISAGSGQLVPSFDDCANANHVFGVNWSQTGYDLGTVATRTGESNIISGTSPGFISDTDYSLLQTSPAINAAGSLPPEATSNYLGLDLTPDMEYVSHLQSQARGGVEDLGAYDYISGSPPASSGKRYRYLSISNNQ